MNLIKLEDVKKSYLNKTFNLTINTKDIILIVGKNGSGKSTLIKLITNYIKPSSGLIKRKKVNIYYLEEIAKLPLNIKASEYLKIIVDIKKTNINYELSGLLNIPLNKYIYELSKGNKQKLALLQTLSFNDGIIILDEPLNGLDSNTIKTLINYLTNLNETLIIVTHYPEDYEKLNAKVVYLWLR